MRRLDSPSLTPTSQHQGTAIGNEAAMAPVPHADIPVSSPRPQPREGEPRPAGTWVHTESAGS
jgi:hypothetical protein